MDFITWRDEEILGSKIKYFETADAPGLPLLMLPGWPVSAVTLGASCE